MKTALLFTCLILSFTAQTAHADRILQTPSADTVSPDSLHLRSVFGPWNHADNLTWLQYGTHQGIELELQRSQFAPEHVARYGLNIAYPILVDLDAIPAVTVGVRDIFATGNEHTAIYLVVGKSTPLSETQSRYIRRFTMTAGVGSGDFNGVFASLRLRLKTGATFFTELYRYRPDVGVVVPVVRGLHAEFDSINGRLFAGGSITILNG